MAAAAASELQDGSFGGSVQSSKMSVVVRLGRATSMVKLVSSDWFESMD